jgi:hypothetical protein
MPSRASAAFNLLSNRPDEDGTRTVKVFKGNPVPALGNQRPFLFITSLKVNTDGTKISYHQDDVTGRRCASNPNATPCAINNVRNAFNDKSRPESDLEAIRDAGYPNPRTWQVLNPKIIEKNKQTNKPCISSDGYLVSMTADVAVPGGFGREGDCDQSKWIDALTVPAFVIPGGSEFLAQGVAKRSIVIAFSPSATKRVVPGIVGDVGPSKELGEASVAMNRKLNGLAENDQPKHRQDAIVRFQAGRSAILIFPGASSVLARPITAQSVAGGGNDALTKFGGAEKLYGCIKDEVDPAF